MPRPTIGGYDWSEQNNGLLTSREKLSMLHMLLRSQLKEFNDLIRMMHPSHQKRLAKIDIAKVPFPDSATARLAEDYIEAVSTPELKWHCFRTYYFGSLLAQAQDINFDPELLLMASLLHDTGLTEGNKASLQGCCFAVTGARLARRFTLDQGWPECRANRVFEAISFHLNPHITEDAASEALLLSQGAMMDVIGARRRLLPEDAIQAVHEKFPRAGFAQSIVLTMNQPHEPSSRAGFLRQFGFRRLASRNPLDKLA